MRRNHTGNHHTTQHTPQNTLWKRYARFKEPTAVHVHAYVLKALFTTLPTKLLFCPTLLSKILCHDQTEPLISS